MTLEEAKWQVLGTDSSPYPLCRGAQAWTVPPHLLGPLCQEGHMSFLLALSCAERESVSMAHFIFGSSEFVKKGYHMRQHWSEGEGMGWGWKWGPLMELWKHFFSLEKNVNFSISLRLENINDFNIPEIVPYHLEHNSPLQTPISNYFKFMIELLSTPVNTLCSTLMIPLVIGETGHWNWSFSLFLWHSLLNRLNITHCLTSIHFKSLWKGAYWIYLIMKASV